MKLHKLKIKSHYFEELESGNKTCEVRYNDRDYQKGDCIYFSKPNSVDPRNNIIFEITHVLYFPEGLKEGYVVLSLKRINE